MITQERRVGDPAARLRFADVLLKTGVRLRYATQGNPGGRPVILLHGYTDSSYSYSTVMPLLSPALRVFALDQRGHGDSDQPESGYALADLAADVVAFLDALGIARATVVGHSLGSFVAQHVARLAPERLTGLVLVGSAADARTEAVQELHEAVQTLRDPIPEPFIREFQESTIYGPLPDGFLERAIGESRKLAARVWHAALAGMTEDAYPIPAPRTVPTLAVWGDRDDIFPRAEQEKLVAALPDARLTVYAETGHAVHWERPERFARDLEAFVL
ncbi:MAG TPA: alpha/beta hydrolase [Armatimonadaceae bacterium]|nr:alpha/beta hydrolase [Armatimonadaceae bacterium]